MNFIKNIELTTDLWSHVFHFLEPTDVVQCSSVSKAFHNLANNPVLWTHIAKSRRITLYQDTDPRIELMIRTTICNLFFKQIYGYYPVINSLSEVHDIFKRYDSILNFYQKDAEIAQIVLNSLFVHFLYGKSDLIDKNKIYTETLSFYIQSLVQEGASIGYRQMRQALKLGKTSLVKLIVDLYPDLSYDFLQIAWTMLDENMDEDMLQAIATTVKIIFDKIDTKELQNYHYAIFLELAIKLKIPYIIQKIGPSLNQNYQFINLHLLWTLFEPDRSEVLEALLYNKFLLNELSWALIIAKGAVDSIRVIRMHTIIEVTVLKAIIKSGNTIMLQEVLNTLSTEERKKIKGLIGFAAKYGALDAIKVLRDNGFIPSFLEKVKIRMSKNKEIIELFR
ncbi:MAG: F-box-like [Chlamydiales bacterium]|jgi:hypothetical protein|nr:F-box-like [Chlamydiales bacterium]